MADTIAVMNGGRIEQLGPPTELYERPRDRVRRRLPRRRRTCCRATSPAAAASGSTTARASAPTPAGRTGRSRSASGPRRSARRRRRRQQLAGTVRESAYIGVATQYVVETAAGDLTVFRQNAETGGLVARARRARHRLSWSPERPSSSTAERRTIAMTARLTRRSSLERAPRGGSRRSPLPGAARGVRRRQRQRRPATRRSSQATCSTLLELAALHRHRREDEASTRRSTSSRRRPAIKVEYIEDINDNAAFFGKIPGPLSQGQAIGRDIIVITDNSRFPALLVNKGWVEKLDKSAIPNIKNLHRPLSSTRPGTRTASTACRGSRA